MDIKDAIKTVKPKIIADKLAAKKKVQDENLRERKEELASRMRDNELLKLVGTTWFPFKEKLLKDADIMEGIKFLEREKEYFRLCSGRNWAVYFCSDGKFKLQRWGMYLGDGYIKPLTIDNIHFLDAKDIETVAKMDFKNEIKKQILKLGTRKYD